MKRKEITTIVVLALGLTVWLSGPGEAVAMETAFTYQGRLTGANAPADGTYDFRFRLYNTNDPCTGNQQGSTVEVNDLDVINGYFTAELDFGSDVFNGDRVWLGIAVRPGDSNDVYTSLTPRQEVTPTPYTLQTRGIFVDDQMNIGMGTTSPTGKLHVDGGKAGGDTDGSNIVVQAQDGGDAVRGLIGRPGGDIILMLGRGGMGSTPPWPPIQARSGNVGIGTNKPSEKLDVEGNIDVSGNRVKSYHGFPRPDYDSGWQGVSKGMVLTLQHNLGGDPNNYVIDMQFKSSDPYWGVNQHAYGGDTINLSFPSGIEKYGVYWKQLTNTQISIHRQPEDSGAPQIRVRIWIYD
jgi:hypothetical protein